MGSLHTAVRVIVGVVCAFLFLGVTQCALRKMRGILLAKRITPPLTLLLLYFAFLIFRLFYPFHIPSNVLQYIEVFFLFLSIYIVIVLTETIFADYILPLRRKAPPPTLLRDIVRWILAVIVLFALLKGVLNIDLSPIIFTSAAVTLILGLALQDLLSNLFAGFTLHMERPFKIGDWVLAGSQVGEVVNVTWRATRIKTLDGDYVIIPNSTISKDEIINYYAPSRIHARHIKVGVSYDAPPNKVKDVMVNAALSSKRVLPDPAPEVWLVDFGDFSITYELKFWIDNYRLYNQIEDDVHTRIWYAFRRNGIHIPFPIRNIYMRSIPKGEQERAREREIAEKVAAMRPVEILRPLSDEELVTLASKVHTHFYGRGEVLVRQGDGGDSFFIVTDGRVAVSVEDTRGRSAVVAHLEGGDFFGEGSLLTGEPRSATVTAAEDTRIILIDKPSFSHILTQNPSIAESLSKILESRLRELAEKKAAAEEVAGKAIDVEPFTVILKKIRRFFGV